MHSPMISLISGSCTFSKLAGLMPCGRSRVTLQGPTAHTARGPGRKCTGFGWGAGGRERGKKTGTHALWGGGWAWGGAWRRWASGSAQGAWRPEEEMPHRPAFLPPHSGSRGHDLSALQGPPRPATEAPQGWLPRPRAQASANDCALQSPTRGCGATRPGDLEAGCQGGDQSPAGSPCGQNADPLQGGARPRGVSVRGAWRYPGVNV